MAQALGERRLVNADVSNQAPPVSRKLVDAFKQKADHLVGNFKDDRKASVTLPLSRRSPEISA